MEIVRTDKFITDFVNLTEELKRQTIKQLRYLEISPRHPSLRVKRIQSVRGVFEARITKSCRLTFHLEPNAIILRRIGSHDKTLKNP